MRILFIVPGYPSTENPSRFSFLKEQVKILGVDDEKERNKKYDVDVLYVDMLPTRKIMSRYKKTIKVEKDSFSDIYSYKMKTFLEKKFPLLTSIIYYKKMCKLFDRYIKEKGIPDIIYAHYTCYAGWAATKLGKKHDISVVVQEHGGYFLSNKIKSRKRKMLIYTLSNSDKFYCVSWNLAKAVQRHTKCKDVPHVLPNVIGKQFKYNKPPSEQEKFIFLAAANLYKGKRIDFLVKAFCETFSFDDAVELRICGSGECLRDIEAIIKKNNRTHQIILYGSLDQSHLIEQYNCCHSFVLPSEHETFGMVYREAMAIGRPIITTDHGGFGEDEFNESMGIMIEVDNRNQLIMALKNMRRDFNKYDFKKISDDTIERYGDKVMRKALDDVFYQQYCNVSK